MIKMKSTIIGEVYTQFPPKPEKIIRIYSVVL